jgi:hypothetical protein
MKTEKQLKEMQLGEILITKYWKITRVYNGWIYSTEQPANAVFVPEVSYNYNKNE